MILENTNFVILFFFIAFLTNVIMTIGFQRQIERNIRHGLKNRQKNKHDKLFYLYLQLDDRKFRQSKMIVNSVDTDSPQILQLINLISKLVISVSLVVITIMVTSVNNIPNTQSNLFEDTDEFTQLFAEFYLEVIHFSNYILNASIFLLILGCAHLSLSLHKRKLIKLHKTVIDEVSEERSRIQNDNHFYLSTPDL